MQENYSQWFCRWRKALIDAARRQHKSIIAESIILSVKQTLNFKMLHKDKNIVNYEIYFDKDMSMHPEINCDYLSRIY